MSNVAIPLPKTVADLMAQRTGKFEKTMNDYVEDLHIRLWENASYKRLLEAVIDGEAVEGSLSCDDHEAARMLREAARAQKMVAIMDRPIASYKHALKVVMRRYQMSRVVRAKSMHGEIVDGAE